jgi:hypothetical protein
MGPSYRGGGCQWKSERVGEAVFGLLGRFVRGVVRVKGSQPQVVNKRTDTARNGL